jgi:hypothetical protein
MKNGCSGIFSVVSLLNGECKMDGDKFWKRKRTEPLRDKKVR